MSAQKFPLTWPVGWHRTLTGERRRTQFKSDRHPISTYAATGRLMYEIDRIQGQSVILSSNLPLRADGLPRGDAREPADPGAAVYFSLKGKPRTLACDKYTTVAGNIAAIAAHVEALRAVDRYGVGTLEQAFGGYTALPAAETEWWKVLGLADPQATIEEVELVFKRLAEIHHPDRPGGSQSMMARLTEARSIARKALGL